MIKNLFKICSVLCLLAYTHAQEASLQLEEQPLDLLAPNNGTQVSKGPLEIIAGYQQAKPLSHSANESVETETSKKPELATDAKNKPNKKLVLVYYDKHGFKLIDRIEDINNISNDDDDANDGDLEYDDDDDVEASDRADDDDDEDNHDDDDEDNHDDDEDDDDEDIQEDTDAENEAVQYGDNINDFDY